MLALGWFLRRTSLFSLIDAYTIAKFASSVTLPALIYHTFTSHTLPPLPLFHTTTALLSPLLLPLLSTFLSLLLLFPTRHPREKGLLSGISVGSWPLIALPIITFSFGPAGVRLALLFNAIALLATWLLSYALFASAGPAFPEKYTHEDGGVYRGEWRGLAKHGLGIYTYPSGARYEGEWRNGVKQGRGVYFFPSGGVYEGEWRAGKQEGLGVRTYGSGKVVAGAWRRGKLDSPTEEQLCVLAVEGANEAAAAARRVKVGASDYSEAIRRVVSQPATWSYIVSFMLMVTGVRVMSPSVGLLTGQLAGVHAYLSLIAAGMLLDTTPPSPRQVSHSGSSSSMYVPREKGGSTVLSNQSIKLRPVI